MRASALTPADGEHAQHGRHTTIDIEALHARARAGAARVRTAIEKRRYRPLRGA